MVYDVVVRLDRGADVRSRSIGAGGSRDAARPCAIAAAALNNASAAMSRLIIE
jgi:hypothetical protein